MGQKINPKGFRIGPLYGWDSRWFSGDNRYREFLLADVKLREVLFSKLKPAGLAKVEIERSINKITVRLHVSRPGLVIGRGGTGLEELKKFVEKFLSKPQKIFNPYAMRVSEGKLKVEVAVEPVKEPNLNAYLVAVNISDMLAKRMPHKRVCNQSINRVMTAGAKGVKIALAGRIAGAEIARREKFQMGTIPLSTIREDVDFAIVPALTKSGYVGIKVWICRKTV